MQFNDHVKAAIQDKLSVHYSGSNSQRARYPEHAALSHYLIQMSQSVNKMQQDYVGPKNINERQLLEQVRELAAICVAAMTNYGCGQYVDKPSPITATTIDSTSSRDSQNK